MKPDLSTHVDFHAYRAIILTLDFVGFESTQDIIGELHEVLTMGHM